MSITQFTTSIPVVFRAEGNQTIPSAWQSRFNFIENTGAMNLTVSNTTRFTGNAEIIIRNSSTSVGDITIVDDNVTIDVSGDLGLTIPPGGIGELKRLGGSTVFSFYGFIA